MANKEKKELLSCAQSESSFLFNSLPLNVRKKLANPSGRLAEINYLLGKGDNLCLATLKQRKKQLDDWMIEWYKEQKKEKPIRKLFDYGTAKFEVVLDMDLDDESDILLNEYNDGILTIHTRKTKTCKSWIRGLCALATKAHFDTYIRKKNNEVNANDYLFAIESLMEIAAQFTIDLCDFYYEHDILYIKKEDDEPKCEI